MLAEEHRTKLDSIVQRMEAEGEQEEDIRAVVEDFKAKYSAPAAISSAPPKPGVFQGFTEHFAPTAAFAHPRKLAEDVGNYFSGLEPKDLLRIGAPIEELIHAGQEIATPIAQAGIEAVERGDSLEAVARGLQFGLSLTPLAGGVVAGEKLADPSTRGEGIGAAAGELANVALPFLPKAAKGAGNAIGGALERNAQARYLSAFDPKKRFQGLAERVAPEALDRGLYGTSRSLQEAAQAQMDSLGPQLREIYSESPARLNVADAAEGALERFGASETIGGQEHGLTSLMDAAQEERAKLRATGQGGEVPILEAWELRKLKEKQAAKRGKYLPGEDPALGAKVQAQTTTADALRGALDVGEPSAAPLNKEYSFNSRLKTLLENKKKPGSFGPTVRAAIVGGLATPFGSGVTAAALARLTEYIFQSTAFKTSSAVLQNKIAKALKSKRIPEAAKLAGIPTQELVQAPQIWDGLTQEGADASIGIRSSQEVALDQLKLQGAQDIYQEPTPQRAIDRMGLPEFEPPVPEPLELDTFSSPTSPEVPPSSRAPSLWGDDAPVGFDMPEAQAQKLLGEFEASGFTPDDLSLEGLSDRQLERLAAADRKASEIALRTISNPTYQRLPVQAGTTGAKTKADVLRNIWERYRGNLGIGTGGGDGS